MKTQIMKGASILTATLLLSWLMAPVIAAPTLGFDRYGTANVNSTLIASWIDGVQYGTNTTLAAGGYEINTVGQDTDITTYKTGGVDTDTIRYSTTDLKGASGRFATETNSFLVGGESSGALTYGSTVYLLKISAVATASAWPAVTQWIRIYNPVGNPNVDVTTYGIGVGTLGSTAIAGGDIASGTNPLVAGQELYINMGSRLSTTGNAIKLYFGSNIVDRV